jgi:diacylglycerol kinase (ATP)
MSRQAARQMLQRSAAHSTPPLKNSILIYNPVAGRHPARREGQMKEAAAALKAAGIAVELAVTAGPGTASDLARAAGAAGKDLVLVCGGDGTVNEVINGLAPGTTTLGILPGGTANILAKELELPHDPVRVARELPYWPARRIALGQATWHAQSPSVTQGPLSGLEVAHQRYFVSVAGIGFDAHIVYKLSTELKMSWGVAGYVLEAFRQAFRYPFPLFACQADGRECRATFAVVHRTRLYAGWLHLAPSASLFEPRFVICLFPSRRWTRYLLYAAAVLARQHRRLSDVEFVDAQRVFCTAGNPGSTIRFELDGELVGTLPATFEIAPDALTLLVPPSQAGN